MRGSPYNKIVMENLPRLLSLLDRNPVSKTYGCSDRSYWHLKFIIDFPSAHYQEMALILALLYQNNFQGNTYFRVPKIREWSIANMAFWARTQHSDGSFSEAYPQEHSFVATAFSLYSVSQAYQVLSADIPLEQKAGIAEAMARAGRWLASHDDLVVLNHQAGAIAALHSLYQITSEPQFLEVTARKVSLLLAQQSEEGWFREYGGADLGYLSMTVDYLAKYYKLSQDRKVLDPLRRAIDFMAWFIEPDGSFGGAYGSRGVEYLCPHGLEILFGEMPPARYILSRFYRGLDSRSVLTPSNMDDRYTAFFLCKYVQAMLEALDREHSPCGSADEVEEEQLFSAPAKYFAESNLLVVSTSSYKAIVGCSKNGVIRIVRNSLEDDPWHYTDSGFAGVLAEGSVVSSQWLNTASSAQVHLPETEGQTIATVTVSAPFAAVLHKLPLRRYLVPFRVFNYLFGWSGRVMESFDRLLKRTHIMGKAFAPIDLKRDIIFYKDEVVITDSVRKQRAVQLSRLRISDKFNPVHCSSSSYFQQADLEDEPITRDAEDELVDRLNRHGVVNVKREVSVSDGRVRWEMLPESTGPCIESQTRGARAAE